MNKLIEYKNLIAFHPGSYVNDIIEEMGITQEEFAKRMGISAKLISELINGKTELSNDTALKLSRLTGVSIDTWMNIQKAYEKKIIEIKDEKELDKEKEIIELIDYSYFVKNGLLEDIKRDKAKWVKDLRELVGVTSLDLLRKQDLFVNFRNPSGKFEEKNIINSNIMMQLAVNKANSADVSEFNKKKLEKFIPEIRKMTVERPKIFYPKLVKGFSDCGIAFVLLPNLPRSGINGAVKKLGKNRVLLLLNDRNKSADIFWFSLFHEIGHVINDDFYVNLTGQDDQKNQFEIEADLFAREILIDGKEYHDFITNRDLNKRNIEQFAEEQGLHPGIVIGRLQNDKYLARSSLNNMKENYRIIMNNN